MWDPTTTHQSQASENRGEPSDPHASRTPQDLYSLSLSFRTPCGGLPTPFFPPGRAKLTSPVPHVSLSFFLSLFLSSPNFMRSARFPACVLLLLVFVCTVLVHHHTKKPFDVMIVTRRTETDTLNRDVCPMQKGKWVYNAKRQNQTDHTCPFVDSRRLCFARGDRRPYAGWEWIPEDGSVLVPASSEAFSRCLRDKRIVFIGDSITRNQFSSFACILYSGRSSVRTIEQKDERIRLHFLPGNITIQFIQSNYLLHTETSRDKRLLVHLGRVDDAWAKSVGTFDIAVIGAFNWWGAPRAFVKGTPERECIGEELFRQMLDVVVPYLDARMKGRPVVWRSFSPAHQNTTDWREAQCLHDRPLTTIPPGKKTARVPLNIVLLHSLANSTASFLDITTLTQYRQDGHPASFTPKGLRAQDCSHWCIPGVPDVWNQILLSMVCNGGNRTMLSCKPDLDL